jgi:hypothetical protein
MAWANRVNTVSKQRVALFFCVRRILPALFFFGKEYHCMDDFMWAIYTTSVGLAVTIYGKV